MGFTNATCYHTVHKNVNKGEIHNVTLLNSIEEIKQSQLMTELFFPLCFNQVTYLITHVINCGFHPSFL